MAVVLERHTPLGRHAREPLGVTRQQAALELAQLFHVLGRAAIATALVTCHAVATGAEPPRVDDQFPA